MDPMFLGAGDFFLILSWLTPATSVVNSRRNCGRRPNTVVRNVKVATKSNVDLDPVLVFNPSYHPTQNQRSILKWAYHRIRADDGAPLKFFCRLRPCT